MEADVFQIDLSQNIYFPSLFRRGFIGKLNLSSEYVSGNKICEQGVEMYIPSTILSSRLGMKLKFVPEINDRMKK